MGTAFKKVLAILCMMVCITSLCCGCGAEKKVEEEHKEETVDFGDTVIRVGDTGVGKDEVMYYMLCIREQYEGYFGNDVWSVSFGDKTFGDMCKEDILHEIVQLKVITSKAEELGIVVTEDEADEIADTVRQQMEEISLTDREKYGITQQLLESIYHDNYLSSKVFDVITGNVDTKVSDEEARNAEFRVLTLKYSGEEEKKETIEKAEELLAQAQAQDADFYSLATVFSNDPDIECITARGSRSAAFDEAAFKLKTGELSDVVVDDEACYIISCVLDYDEDATAQTKEEIISRRQEDAFKKYYDEWEKDCTVSVDIDKWEKISF